MRRLLLVLLLLAAPLLAQDEERDNGFLINLLEDQLSTETRKIRLSGIEGLLSSAAQVERITISDTEGIWLQIDNAQIVWSRAALLRGRVEVETLAAERVSIPRGPLPAGGPALPQAEPTPFRLPDLPVSVDLGALEIGRVVFGADLFGLEAEMEVAGNLTLAGGALDAGLEMTRLDGPGGALRLEAGFDNADARLRLDLALEEPAGGIVANALNLPGQPEVDLALAGDGPLDALELALNLDVAGARTVEGSLTLDETAADARRFEAEVRGELTPLLAPDARQFFEGETRLALVGEARESGETIIEALTVQTAVLDLSGSLETQAGGFPETIRLAGALATADGSRVTLPGGTVSLERADLDVVFGTGRTWTAEIRAEAVETADLTIGEARLSVDGVLENADDPTSRAISARISAALAELDADAPEVRAALGPRITLTSRLDWQAGTPFRLGETRLSGRGLEARIEGDVDDGVFDGRVEAAIVTLTPFSGIVGRDIAGALSFAATGQVEPLARTFDLVLSGEAGDFQLGDPRLDGLLSGETTLAGRIARTADGVRATGFRLGNAQAEVTLDGVYATAATDMGLAARLSEVGLLTS
ncbi:MAG: translocation/assembly module TamB, partial [Pseudomonadota bacterium]